MSQWLYKGTLTTLLLTSLGVADYYFPPKVTQQQTLAPYSQNLIPKQTFAAQGNPKPQSDTNQQDYGIENLVATSNVRYVVNKDNISNFILFAYDTKRITIDTGLLTDQSKIDELIRQKSITSYLELEKFINSGAYDRLEVSLADDIRDMPSALIKIYRPDANFDSTNGLEFRVVIDFDLGIPDGKSDHRVTLFDWNDERLEQTFNAIRHYLKNPFDINPSIPIKITPLNAISF